MSVSDQSGASQPGPDLKVVWLLAATFFVAVAGLIYELIAATISSYLLGDSIRQFSFVIGVFLTAMGAGAWLSRFAGDALSGFVRTQIALGVIGGAAGPLLFFAYAIYGAVSLPLYAILMAIGILSGMEIPLITRVLKEIGAAEFRFENVLTADYIGALAASLAFPLLIVPNLSLMAASLSFGVMNLAVAGFSLWLFRDRLPRGLWLPWAAFLLAALTALVLSERLVASVDARLFQDEVIFREETPYQSITITRFDERYRLFLDHSIQFDSLDEHRYHEMLVHPAMGLAPRRAHVLILGGGDGMAAREVLRHDGVERVTLVDLDPRVTEIFAANPDLAALNNGALTDPRVEIVSADAWTFIAEDDALYDVVIADLPDPKTIALSKLYSIEFYNMLAERLTAQGLIVTQSGSPTFARNAFWTVAATLDAARNPFAPDSTLETLAYHAYVPSFGDWGFVMAGPALPAEGRAPELPDGLRFLTAAQWYAAQVFPADTGPVEVEVNSIQGHPLVALYQRGWDYWFR
ncbi:polyamine aminopropyltransferase [Roseibacterium beibuensis]|uniref:Polyamine aminopropyltransferase n=1 Tax=[Roseibacterium] beibuensis TaxID=1193142 RepID=A0ABP9KVB1_9RHOB|nr:polyamine aminopropyltransferase [Roseibacterium beibuensis]MCS6622437.1 polyamine aminopropyltransferase [Roseibacterium beibuensis]